MMMSNFPCFLLLGCRLWRRWTRLSLLHLLFSRNGRLTLRFRQGWLATERGQINPFHCHARPIVRHSRLRALTLLNSRHQTNHPASNFPHDAFELRGGHPCSPSSALATQWSVQQLKRGRYGPRP
ncbi:uncharacterized protein IWZ02DRAFT_223457 [Phyllosticta citriasiana]|uniref:uncharacterized protein n=1 Tax=Phyllosticta citriasiana TaxID=595635 RepID=UPI0030FD2667